MDKNINIFSLGGQDENGKNCYVIEVENDIYIVNAGIKVPINNRFGVDGIIPSFEYLKERSNRIKGLFITHAHDDNFAAIPWLLMEIKGLNIYSSKFTKLAIMDRVSKYNINHNKYEFHELQESQKIGDIIVKSFSVANSIPGSLAFNFQTPSGDIIFMSNFVIDDLGPFGKTDLARIKESASENILALMVDSGRSNFQGKSADHKSVLPIIEKEFRNAPKNERIIVGGYDEEMYVLQEIIDLAIQENRPIALYGRAFGTLFKNMSMQYPKNKFPKIIDYKDVNSHDNVVVLVTGTWSRIYQRFVRITENDDVYLKLRKSDHIVMVAPPINGLEVLYSETLDKIAKFSPNIIEVTFTDYYSLRPANQDIFDVVRFLKPKYFLPISGLYRYLITSVKIAQKVGMFQENIIVLFGGKIAHFINGKLASQKTRLKEFGEVIIDGFGVGDISYGVLKERESLSAGGLVAITVQLSRNTRKALEPIDIQLIGVVVNDRHEEIKETIQDIVKQKVLETRNFDMREVQNQIKKKVQKALMKSINKEPLVITTFYII